MWVGWYRLWESVTPEVGVGVGAPRAPGAGRGTRGGVGGPGCSEGSGCWRRTAAATAHAVRHSIGGQGLWDGRVSVVTFFRDFLRALLIFFSQAWSQCKRGARKVPAPRGQRTGKPDKMYADTI